MPAKIKQRQEFKGNSLKAVKKNGTYKIISYSTTLYREGSNKPKMFDYGYYSTTTSRQQNVIREALNLPDFEKRKKYIKTKKGKGWQEKN